MPKIGLKDLHYAKLLTDPTGGPATYDTPVKIAGAVTATITPNVNSDTFYADDGPMDTVTALGEVEVSIGVGDLPLEVEAALLGQTVDATTGTITKKSTDVAPYVAIGFKSLKSNGKYRYVWLVKGKFREMEENFETKGETVNFQPASIVGAFVRREADSAWKHVTDEDAVAANTTTMTKWFLQVDPVSV